MPKSVILGSEQLCRKRWFDTSELEVVLVPALVLHVSLYGFVPIIASADRSGIELVSPELATPQSLSYGRCRVFGKYTLSGNTFEEPHDLADAVLGMEAEQSMDIVLVIAELFDVQVVPLFNAFQCFPHGSDDWCAQQSLAVLEWHDEVVEG